MYEKTVFIPRQLFHIADQFLFLTVKELVNRAKKGTKKVGKKLANKKKRVSEHSETLAITSDRARIRT